VDAAALTDVDERLDSPIDEVFSSPTRKDQRATAGVYARGLAPDGRRESMQQMAQRLGVDHQRLQQFVVTSPWLVVPVRKRLSRKAWDAATSIDARTRWSNRTRGSSIRPGLRCRSDAASRGSPRRHGRVIAESWSPPYSVPLGDGVVNGWCS